MKPPASSEMCSSSPEKKGLPVEKKRREGTKLGYHFFLCVSGITGGLLHFKSRIRSALRYSTRLNWIDSCTLSECDKFILEMIFFLSLKSRKLTRSAFDGKELGNG